MNTKSLILTLTVLVFSGGFVLAQEAQNSEEVQVVTTVTPTSNAVEVGNKVCPVSGNKVPVLGQKGEMGGAVKIMYKGRIYNLCCPMCIKDFKKYPEKYSKIAEDEVKATKK